MGRAFCVLSEFEPFGRRAEAAVGAAAGSNDSYFLFDPGVARAHGDGVEQAVVSGCGNHYEEEIFIRDNVVVWSAGHHVRKRFSASSTVLKACWCSMESTPEPLLCILHSNSLSTYTPSGEFNSVPFSSAMSSMWPMPSGLLLQRAAEAVPYSVSPAAETSGSVYFTLQHNLEEPEALCVEVSGRIQSLVDSDEQIIWTSGRLPYAVSYHSGRKQHTVWEVKSTNSRLEQGRTLERSNSMYLLQCWREQGSNPQAAQVFIATDDDREPLVCFVIKDAKRLFAIKLSRAPEPAADVAWSISAVSAVPIVASQPTLRRGLPRLDMLVLAPDGNVFLYTGRYPLCTYVLPASVLQQTGQHRVEKLLDSVNTRANVLTSSGKIYRCIVELIPSSGITRSCLLALSEGLRPSFYRFVLGSLMEFKPGQLNKTDSSFDKDWSAFSGIMMQWTGERRSDSYKHRSLSSWEFLLQSNRHRNGSHPYPSRRYELCPTHNSKNERSGYSSMLLEVLETLHLVYEDFKLDVLRWGEMWKLGVLLNSIAVAVEEYDYADHYVRDFPTVVTSRVMSNVSSRSSGLIINHFTWIENLLRKKHATSRLPALLTKEDGSLDWSRKVLGFFEVLLGSGNRDKLLSGICIKFAPGTATNAEQMTVLAMVGERFGLSHLDRLPCGLSLPLRHALNSCRESPPADWPPDAYILLGREDLAYMSASRKSGAKDVTMAAQYMLHLRPTLPFTEREPIPSETPPMEGQASDGMEHIFTPSATLRFGSDLRLNEVRRVLCSSKPVAVRTANAPDVSDPDLVAQQQAQLWQLAQRTTALPFGRGAFTLSTLRPLLTEALPIPKLVLAGRLPSQHDATVNLDVNAGNVSEFTSWPEFHNGVAAGLRLAPGQAKITRTWIVYNKPDEPSYEHAGFLMSLGLHKHLAVLAATDVFRYLAQEHDPTTVGILLGMAAAHRGTMDPAMSKMLYLHIPARHPPSFPELELSSLLQSAALMAVGLLYQGSAHRLTTEILLAEIGRKPGSDSSLDREGYALAAGVALGLVTLGRGKDAWGLADLQIEDRLRHYMCGGSETSDEYRRRFDGASGFSSVSKSFDDQNQTGGQVMEGSIVNLDVTAPGATLALALMFMKTNDHVVAARLAIPDTHFALEYVRPDFILLRLIARSLILWDSVQATEEWIQSQVPDIIRQAVVQAKGSDAGADVTPDLDMEALTQAHVNILAGACLSIGLRYAGTANAEAQTLLQHYALYFMKEVTLTIHGYLISRACCWQKSQAASGTSPNDRRVDRGTLETCLDVAVLSLSVVMAGTGHLETLRLLRYLRQRNDTDIVYGNHMAVSLAIGFLFLGGGSLTFSTSNGAVAALLISLYPRFPTSPNDHRCHLQAFRHLYVLATEARCVQTMDVDTGLLVYAPLEMTLHETSLHCETTFSRVSPCILPERSALKRVRVCGPRYWSQDMQFLLSETKPWWEHGETGDPFNGGVLYVKRKVGARSYADDPIGSRSLLSRALQRVLVDENADFTIRDQSKVDELVGAFSSDPSLLAFAHLFCSSSFRGEFQDFCLLALFECVSMDKPALLQTYIGLYTSVEALINRVTGRGNCSESLFYACLAVQNLKVSLAYCGAAGHDPALQGPSLIQRTFLVSLAKRMDDILTHWKCRRFEDREQLGPPPELISYLSSHTWPRESGSSEDIQRLMFACYVSWEGVPQPALVTKALLEIQQSIPDWSKQDRNSLLPMLASLLPGTPPRTLLQITYCLPLL
ncbi:anaphase-promoting complex subunit 1 isoform X2 [Selaginella moellendorffii]|uniref:anaphase-promoting complex subunit 1 isoform X2 n=1 Tax=Selaginella moellendorffii TaxID=88036 RepID=UPI000D1C4996|nr:anaphase-promoting complex subunit 1 isoform X2 [Selaginella moellendorffii]|eukprot:XP_024523349.1 anaphase-promoting complex subunit 1 isoform X2 [Selaginella moellendorffii]